MRPADGSLSIQNSVIESRLCRAFSQASPGKRIPGNSASAEVDVVANGDGRTTEEGTGKCESVTLITLGYQEAGEMDGKNSFEERTTEQLLRALKSIGDCVEASPRKLGGIPVLKDTRFSVSQLLAELADGDDVQEVADNYDLDADQISRLLHAFSIGLNRSLFQ